MPNYSSMSSGLTLGTALLLSAAAAGGATISGKVDCTYLRDNADIVVFLERSLDHPNMEFRPPAAGVVMNQRNLAFVPHILPVLRGTEVHFGNSDQVRHNITSPSEAKRFNLGTYPEGTVRHVVFDQVGEVALLCGIHREMSAYVIVIETPFFAVTDPAGNFEIKDVPAGRYVLKTWHETMAAVSQEINITGSTLRIDIELTEFKN